MSNVFFNGCFKHTVASPGKHIDAPLPLKFSFILHSCWLSSGTENRSINSSWGVHDSAIMTAWPLHGSCKGQVQRQDTKTETSGMYMTGRASNIKYGLAVKWSKCSYSGPSLYQVSASHFLLKENQTNRWNYCHFQCLVSAFSTRSQKEIKILSTSVFVDPYEEADAQVCYSWIPVFVGEWNILLPVPKHWQKFGIWSVCLLSEYDLIPSVMECVSAVSSMQIFARCVWARVWGWRANVTKHDRERVHLLSACSDIFGKDSLVTGRQTRQSIVVFLYNGTNAYLRLTCWERLFLK